MLGCDGVLWCRSSPLSASMGHINTIGSLDRGSLGTKAAAGATGAAPGEMAMSCRSMATLSRLAPYGGEAPPPYEMTLSQSVEEVVRDGGMLDEWTDEYEGGWIYGWGSGYKDG